MDKYGYVWISMDKYGYISMEIQVWIYKYGWVDDNL